MIRNAGFNRRIAPNFLEVIQANQIDIVLDVGANDGDYGRELRGSGYTGRILSLDPVCFAIQVETSLVDSYVGETDWIESMLYMRDHGFEVATMICNSTIPSKARVREFDIVYVRNDA